MTNQAGADILSLLRTSSASKPPVSPAKPAKKKKPTKPPASAPPIVDPDQENVKHLVGRALVPFYLPDGQENNAQTVLGGVDFSVEQVEYRPFAGGYFQETISAVDGGQRQGQVKAKGKGNAKKSSGAFGPSGGEHGRRAQQSPSLLMPEHASLPRPASRQSSPALHSKSINTRVKNSNNSNSTSSNKIEAKRASHSKPPQAYAAGAFQATPSPKKVPMPKFMSSMSARRLLLEPATTPALKPHAAHPDTARLMGMLKGGNAALESKTVEPNKNQKQPKQQQTQTQKHKPQQHKKPSASVSAAAPSPIIYPTVPLVPPAPAPTQGASVDSGSGMVLLLRRATGVTSVQLDPPTKAAQAVPAPITTSERKQDSEMQAMIQRMLALNKPGL